MTNTIAQAEAYARAHPQKTDGAGGPSWDGWCAALMFWAGGFSRSADTAAEARSLSAVESDVASSAPAGAFHWWDISGTSAGHVGLDLTGRGDRVLMATGAVAESWGNHIGVNSVNGYQSMRAATYRGWSSDFIGQRLADVGVVDTTTGLVIQRLARTGGYTGPLDGLPGVNTWRALQGLLQRYDYRGPLDGVPGTNTYKALQRLASAYGYTGPVDGVPGARTFEAVERAADM